MGICPSCGAPFEGGTLVCPRCGNEITRRTVEPTGEGDQLADSGLGDTLTGDGYGDTIDHVDGSDIIGQNDGGGEAEPPIEVDPSVPGSEIPPSHGGGVDHSQPPSEEPPEGLTDTKGIDMPHGELPDRDLSMDGPAVDLTGGAGPSMPSPDAGEPAGPPPERRTMRLQFGALVVIIVIVIAVAVALFLMAGDDEGDGNGNGEPNGEPNGPNGNGPKEGLHIDPLETSVEVVWEPNPGFHLDVILLNNATERVSLENHDIYVTVFFDGDKVGQATELVSGEMVSGASKWVPVDVVVDIQSGQTYKVSVMLRRDGANYTVDMYYKQMTIE